MTAAGPLSTPGGRLSILDHIVIAGPDLDALIDWFADLTGVHAPRGGAHPTGTANALVALTRAGRRGPHYIELIGPDPDRVDPAIPTTFGIDGLDVPAVVAYSVHPADIDATAETARKGGVDLGTVQPLSRRTPSGELLEWRLTRGAEHRLDLPFLIDWGSTPHPGLGPLPTLELVTFERVEPDPSELEGETAALGLGDGVAKVVPGDRSGYRLRLARGDGSSVDLGV